MPGPAATAAPSGAAIPKPSDWRGELRTSLSRTPLVPVALAVSAGVICERSLDVPFRAAFAGLDELLVVLFAAVMLAGCGWTLAWHRSRAAHGLLCLLLIAALLGAGWHRLWRFPAIDDIGRDADADGKLVRVRGLILELRHEQAEESHLQSRPALPEMVLLLRVLAGQQAGEWQTRTGQVRAWVSGQRHDLEVGDEIELLGTLQQPHGPGNPGEIDLRQHARDQGTHAFLHVKSAEVIAKRAGGSSWSPRVLFARLRHAGAEQLQRGLRPDTARVARALILGEQSELERKQFNAYLRTGLFHILAISGQHVVILCGLLWLILRALHVPRRIQALVMLALVLSYCLLTGARPPMVRAASVVGSFCVGMMLARRSQPLNSLALAWIATIVINPTDIFQTGCQISYLGVLVLFQILTPLRRAVLDAQDPLQQLIAQSRPLWQRVLLQAGSWVWWTLLANLLLTLAFTPLLATRYHIISPIAVPLGPPLIFLTAVALVLGFIYLALAPIAPWLVGILGWSIEQLLLLCAILVEWGATLPLSFWHAAGLPEWTLWLLYVPMIAFLIFPPLHRYWKCLIAGAMCWLVLALPTQVQRPIDPGLRCTVLSVGHGSCVVLELPDGRVLLYDAGSLPGPDVTTKKIAPFLWHRGISRIDEVLVSHADLDHFNGLPSLVDRFRLGQVTWTPTFAERPEPAVRVVTQALEDRGIRTRVVNRGERLTATDVDLHVLHPPPRGPAGKENARSLVLLISYAGRTLLLTGDLEEPGLSEVTAMPPPKVDVLLAPHHGSRFSNTEAFAVWCKPGLVVSSEGRPRGPRADPFTPLGATVWRTWHDGAATIIMDEQGVRAESFRTNKHWAR